MRVDKFTLRKVLSIGLLVLIGWWALSLIVWGVKSLAGSPHYSCPTKSVPVNAGDTIYSIVREHCSGDLDSVTATMVAMYGTQIDTWQTLHLPIDSPRKP